MKKNFFTFLPVENGQKNWFDLGHSNSGSCNMGGLYPVLVEPTLPGDYFKCDISYLLRMAQMVAPPMTRIGVSFFPFYCPNRILMDGREWDKFIADVDGVSGVSLPFLSFTDLTGHIIETIDFDDVARFVADIFGMTVDSVGSSYMYFDSENGQNIYPDDLVSSHFSAVQVDRINSDLRLLYSDSTALVSSAMYMSEAVAIVAEYYTKFPFVGSLLDYMGLPVSSPILSTSGLVLSYGESDSFVFTVKEIDDPDRKIQALPIIAYLRIWNEYFRQEFIQEEINSDLVDNFNEWKSALSSDLSVLWKIKRRDWEHDYYTSCLPSAQLGEASSIAIGSDGKFTIPELREGNVIQRIREKLLHGGTRVWEIVANFFSERVSDSRIQIPEYIRPKKNTGFSWLRISDIYQTAPGSSDSTPGLDAGANIAAPRGASVNTNNLGLSFSFKAEEHGYLIVLMNIQPEPMYCQGIPRHFMSLDPLDYGWPDFANITEQPVYQYEIFASRGNTYIPADNTDYPIFGYQSQYAWYKFHQGEIHGELRDDLDFFTFARIFESTPNLNDEFLQCNPTDRPFPISYEYDKLTYHLAIDLRVNRRLPYFGIPSLR